MRRIDLVAATMQGWSRLDPARRDQFFEAFVSAALRLDRVAMRDWLLKRLRNRPLAAPIDPASFAISDRDMALLLKQLPLRVDDADRGAGLWDAIAPRRTQPTKGFGIDISERAPRTRNTLMDWRRASMG